MPTKHRTRSWIADEVPGVEYGDWGRSRTREREFRKAELVAIHNRLCEGLFLDRKVGDETPKTTVRFRLRLLMDDAGYDGFGHEQQDGNPLRSRELLTVLTGCKDANENLRWSDGGGGA